MMTWPAATDKKADNQGVRGAAVPGRPVPGADPGDVGTGASAVALAITAQHILPLIPQTAGAGVPAVRQPVAHCAIGGSFLAPGLPSLHMQYRVSHPSQGEISGCMIPDLSMAQDLVSALAWPTRKQLI